MTVASKNNMFYSVFLLLKCRLEFLKKVGVDMYMCVCVYICIYKQVCVSNIIVFPNACVFHTEMAVLESQNNSQ